MKKYINKIEELKKEYTELKNKKISGSELHRSSNTGMRGMSKKRWVNDYVSMHKYDNLTTGNVKTKNLKTYDIVGDPIDSSIDYSDYISSKIYKSISYTEYIADNLSNYHGTSSRKFTIPTKRLSKKQAEQDISKLMTEYREDIQWGTSGTPQIKKFTIPTSGMSKKQAEQDISKLMTEYPKRNFLKRLLKWDNEL